MVIEPPGKKVVIDRSAETLVVEDRPLFFLRRRVIPFSRLSVGIGCKFRKQGESKYFGSFTRYLNDNWHWEETWRLFLNTGGKKVEICRRRQSVDKGGTFGHNPAEAAMQHLAYEIRNFIGTEHPQKAEELEKARAREEAREKAIAKMKKQYEKDFEERMQQRYRNR